MADAFDEAANAVYNQGGFNASDMTTDAARKLLTATANTIKQGVDSHLPVDVPPTLRYALENNAFIFSGLKTFHALREVGLSMVKDDGSIKSFEEFKDDVKQINSKYNTNYLYAEYKHAVGTSQMAAKWVNIEADGDRYDLQYRTAGDDKVRPDHAALNALTVGAAAVRLYRYVWANTSAATLLTLCRQVTPPLRKLSKRCSATTQVRLCSCSRLSTRTIKHL